MEIEKARIKDREKIEKEKAELNAEVEIAKITQEIQIREIGNRKEHRQNGFDLTKQVQLVSLFNEEDIDKYLLQFEKVASNLSWLLDVWSHTTPDSIKG